MTVLTNVQRPTAQLAIGTADVGIKTPSVPYAEYWVEKALMTDDGTFVRIADGIGAAAMVSLHTIHKTIRLRPFRRCAGWITSH
jgi:hypothetical protein